MLSNTNLTICGWKILPHQSAYGIPQDSTGFAVGMGGGSHNTQPPLISNIFYGWFSNLLGSAKKSQPTRPHSNPPQLQAIFFAGMYLHWSFFSRQNHSKDSSTQKAQKHRKLWKKNFKVKGVASCKYFAFYHDTWKRESQYCTQRKGIFLSILLETWLRTCGCWFG